MHQTFSPPPKFPVEALPQLMRNAVMEVVANTNLPIELVATTALGVLSLVCQNGADVQSPDGEVSPTSLFLLCVADPSDRLSMMQRAFYQPIQGLEERLREKLNEAFNPYQWEADRLAWEVERKTILSDITKAAKSHSSIVESTTRLANHLSKRPKNSPLVKFLYRDNPLDEVRWGLSEHWPTACMVSQAPRLLFQRKTFANMSFINNLWDSGTLPIDRRNIPNSMTRTVRLTIALTITPDMFDHMMEHTDKGTQNIGCLSRFLIAYPRQTPANWHTQKQKYIQDKLTIFHTNLQEILEVTSREETINNSRVTFTLSPESEVDWLQAVNRIESHLQSYGTAAKLKAYGVHYGANVLRLSAIFNAMEMGQSPIPSKNVKQAVQVCDWYFQEFERLSAYPNTQNFELKFEWQLENWLISYGQDNGILHEGKRHVKKNTVRQLCPYALRKENRLDAALDYLVQMHKINYAMIGDTCYLNIENLILSARRFSP